MNCFINNLMRYGPPVIRMACLGVLLLVGLSGASRAKAASNNWQFSLPVSVTGGAYYASDGGQGTTVDAVYTSSELRFSSRLRNYSLGLFYDYAGSSDEHIDGTQNLGAVHRMRLDKWDTATYVFGHKPTRARRRWAFATRVRYRIAENHKVGIETVGLFNEPSTPKLMLAYYGTISESLSARIAFGTILDTATSRIVQAEFTWQVL